MLLNSLAFESLIRYVLWSTPDHVAMSTHVNSNVTPLYTSGCLTCDRNDTKCYDSHTRVSPTLCDSTPRPLPTPTDLKPECVERFADPEEW